MWLDNMSASMSYGKDVVRESHQSRRFLRVGCFQRLAVMYVFRRPMRHWVQSVPVPVFMVN